MGKIGKAFGKILDVAKPFISMVNPALGAAVGFASGLMQGKNPLKAALGAVTDLIPGSGLLKGLAGKFGGALLDGAGGNSLFSGLLDMATGKGKVTDLIGGLTKGLASKGGLTDLGLQNAQELSAQRMAQLLFK